MPITFDATNKLILIQSGTTSPLNALTIYSDAMDWSDSPSGMAYTPPMAAVGKAPLGGGVYSDSIFSLQGGWKIKLYAGTYQFVIKGTVITDDETARTVPPDSGNVEVVFQVSSQATVMDIDTIDTISTRVNLLRRLAEGRWKLANNQMIIYDDDGVTELRKFNLLSTAGQPTEKDVYERVPVQ